MTDRQAPGGAGDRKDGGTAEAQVAAETTREAKASVHEAIGKLIGDDAAEVRGGEGRKAAATDAAPDSTDAPYDDRPPRD